MEEYVSKEKAIQMFQGLEKGVQEDGNLIAAGAYRVCAGIIRMMEGVEVDQANLWHPSTEPPITFVSVLVEMPGEDPFPTVREGYISDSGIWVAGGFRREPGEVMRWRPMPLPPKKEEPKE